MMRIFKLCTLALVLGAPAWMGCGSSGGAGGAAGTGGAPLGTGGMRGAGGSVALDAAGIPDAPTVDAIPLPDLGPAIDRTPGESNPSGPFLDCTGLPPAQCHDLIINPPSLPDGVLPQDPGPAPTVGYPECTAG